MFPSVHESELSERNKNRGRCNFFSVFAKEGEGEGNQPVGTALVTLPDK